MSKTRKKNSAKRKRKARPNPTATQHQNRKSQMTLDAAERERLDAVIADYESKQKDHPSTDTFKSIGDKNEKR